MSKPSWSEGWAWRARHSTASLPHGGRQHDAGATGGQAVREKRACDLAFALAASVSRFFGGAEVTSSSSMRITVALTSWIARA